MPNALLDLRTARESCPIVVGIGASAGGLEALSAFFDNVPNGSGAAYVVIQHLDPTHECMLAELLQKHTTMPTIEVEDCTPVESDHVYVIPPNKSLSILNGVLHLLERPARPALSLPVDFFFRSLALDQRSRGIGVVLSGMGSDGVIGLRSIKENAGAVFVQSPASARFDGMPRSIIDAGLADVVADPEELPGKIFASLRHGCERAQTDPTLPAGKPGELSKVVLLLRQQTGNDFSLYKESTIRRRVERRMGLHQLASLVDYVRLLQENPQETELLLKELLIGVTNFFRDPEVWDQLKREVIPALIDACPNDGTLRAWVPACSTGEEAYSLAITFKEVLEELKPAKRCALQIFATDLDKDSIAKARSGLYPFSIAIDVSEERLHRFFTKGDSNYQVAPAIREMVIFAPHNLVTDPPFTKLNLLSCRNFLIYVQPDLQKKLLSLFFYGLRPGGFLLLGSAETIGSATDLFVPLAGNSRFYRRLDVGVLPEHLEFPTAFAKGQTRSAVASPPCAELPAPNLKTLADQLLLQRYAPAAVLVTEAGDILYVNGRTGTFLEPAAGKANWNVFAMAREGLNYALNEAFPRAVRVREVVTLEDVEIRTNGVAQLVDITIQPVTEIDALQGTVLVVFSKTRLLPPPAERSHEPSPNVVDTRLAAMSLELQKSREELQISREEMQAGQESLKSYNEELQSTNEELQSAIEELTTSREELQSMNEELQTVNQELRSKMEELSFASNDIKNLLDGTDIATLFLDESLRVRRFTAQTAKIIKLIPSDIGRSVTDIASTLGYNQLTEDVENVLRQLISFERQVSASDGRWFSMRIMPYRTCENRIDGVVITFSDITQLKKLESELRDAEARLHDRDQPGANSGNRP